MADIVLAAIEPDAIPAVVKPSNGGAKEGRTANKPPVDNL